MTGKLLDGVFLLNQRWRRDGTRLFGAQWDRDDPCTPPGNRYLLVASVWEIRQKDRQISYSFAYVGGK